MIHLNRSHVVQESNTRIYTKKWRKCYLFPLCTYSVNSYSITQTYQPKQDREVNHNAISCGPLPHCIQNGGVKFRVQFYMLRCDVT